MVELEKLIPVNTQLQQSEQRLKESVEALKRTCEEMKTTHSEELNRVKTECTKRMSAIKAELDDAKQELVTLRRSEEVCGVM